MNQAHASSAPANSAFATRMLASSTRLTPPAKSLFDRIFLNGESEKRVMSDLSLTPDEFGRQKTNMLRSLMIACQ